LGAPFGGALPSLLLVEPVLQEDPGRDGIDRLVARGDPVSGSVLGLYRSQGLIDEEKRESTGRAESLREASDALRERARPAIEPRRTSYDEGADVPLEGHFTQLADRIVVVMSVNDSDRNGEPGFVIRNSDADSLLAEIYTQITHSLPW
jgi:hypothetical protein